MVHDGDKEFVIDANGEKIIAPEYETIAQISTSLDHYFAYDGKSWILINEKGEEVSKESFKYINFLSTRNDLFYSELIGASSALDDQYDYNDSVAVDEDYYYYDSVDSAY